MSLFVRTPYEGRLVWIGNVSNRQRTLKSSSCQAAELKFGGIPADSHFGKTREACVRTEQLYEEGTEIVNVRQLTVVSKEELAHIAATMKVDELDPSFLGANLMIEGIPDLTLVPPSSRLQFSSATTLTVDMINLPCNLPAREIERELPGHGRLFKSAARNRRGVTAWVEREGTVEVGSSVALFVPAQTAWPRLSEFDGIKFGKMI
ncbi:MAG: MOSC domain-containing protein [Rhodobacteraceae bacterium]|nr:MOSC domain-containing protein [Paracoccaceae bacterium]